MLRPDLYQRQSTTPRGGRHSPGIEPLEARIAPAATISFSGGVLTVTFQLAGDTATIAATDSTGQDFQLERPGFATTVYNSVSEVMVNYLASDETLTATDPFGTFNLPGGFFLNNASNLTGDNLTDESGGNTFDFSNFVGKGTFTGGATKPDTLALSTSTLGPILTDTSLTASFQSSVDLSLVNISSAILTNPAGSSGNEFTISGWTHGGTLINAGPNEGVTVVAAKAASFILTDTSLSSSDGMQFALSQTPQQSFFVTLTDTAGGNTFTVDHWTYGGTLANSGTAKDTVSAAKAGGFSLTDSSLTDTADTMNLTLAQTGGGIQIANLLDTVGGHTFVVDGWTYGATLANSGGAGDTISATKAGGFTLTNAGLTDTADAMALTFLSTPSGIQTANLTDSVGGKTFDVGGWTHGGTLADSGTLADTVVAAKPGGFTLTNTSLSATDGMSVTFAAGAIGTAKLTDTTGGHAFTVTDWTHGGSLVSQGAADTINYTDTITNTDTPVTVTSKSKSGKTTSVTYNIGVVLTNDLLYSSNTMALALTNIGTAKLTAGSGADEILDASQYTGNLTLTGSAGATGANNDTLIAGLGTNTLIGGMEADRFVLTGFSVSDTLTPSTEAANGVTGQRDLIDYSARLYPSGHSKFNKAGVTVNLGLIGTAQAVNVKSNNPAVKAEGLLTLTGLFDDLEGSKYNDKLKGDSLSNVIYGGGGVDSLAGGGVPPRLPGKPDNRDYLVGNGSTVFVSPARGSEEIDNRYRSGIAPFPKILPIIVPEAIFAMLSSVVAPDPFIQAALAG